MRLRLLCTLFLLLLLCGAAYAPVSLGGLGAYACAVLMVVVWLPRG